MLILSERSQTRKATYVTNPSVQNAGNRSRRDAEWVRVARAWGRGRFDALGALAVGGMKGQGHHALSLASGGSYMAARTYQNRQMSSETSIDSIQNLKPTEVTGLLNLP